MKRGDWIKINFTGRIKATGEIFDLTGKEEAKKEDVFDEKKKYGPVLVIMGGGFIIPGVEKQLLEMKTGEKKKFDVSPAEALGPRKRELLRVVSVSKFIQKNINPYPGMWINIDGRNCKVLSVSGGRVRVDMNHPLAGKILSYEVEVTEEIKGTGKRVESLLDYYDLRGKISITGKKVGIETESEVNPMVSRLVGETLKKWAGGIDDVEFSTRKKPAGKKDVKNSPKKGAEKSPRAKA